ncbi:uncharacterized protein F5891DRAFT_1195387 [Suillus fuscotomentosus]|uniref:Uncharacterized protein n=1 Tax=Suillus fuscotomentosus TaxID=1912939 RepID=A0AAD4HE40_9AGAM|nr:uncharacterized protein F5891DRAFT_1195387 [Suillus fuscotomentosus]KAG1894255.1 hypothetical protein F5891DRAFT_1195387 [Suillus fuscotomentosus]
MKLKEGNSVAGLALSDEIARHVAKDLKLYAGHATSFSPQLLSYVAVVWQYSKAGIFQALLDWTTIVDNDSRIKHHPRFHKTVNYRHVTSFGVTEPVASGLADVQATSSTLPFDATPEGRSIAHVQDPALTKDILSPAIHAHASTPAALFYQVPPTPPQTVMTPLEPLTPLYPSTAAAPSKDNPSVTGNMKTQAKTVRQSAKEKNRQVEDNATNKTHRTHRPAPCLLSRKSAPKRKKFMSDDEENRPTGSILITRKHTLSASTASAVAGLVNPMPSDMVDKGFWDADTRLAGWGHDSTIATAVEYSVRYNPRKCDKCVKLDVPCIVLPDKKHGFTQLACANCDEMKITCTIDGVGIQEKLQAKLKGDEALPPKCTQIHTPKLCPTKTQAKAVTTKKKKNPAHVFTCAGQKVVPSDLSGDSHADRPMEGVTPHLDPLAPPATVQPITDPMVRSGRLQHQPEPEPTARDILHSIYDLSRQFDLLATNKRVDVLDTRLGVMEKTLDVRLTVLEKRLSTSNQHWTATSSSLGNLAMALRKHKDDQMMHRPHESIAGDSQSQQHKAMYLLWSLHNTGSSDEEAALQIARQPPGVNSKWLDNARRSVSTAVAGTSLPFASSPLSSWFSSAPPSTSGK